MNRQKNREVIKGSFPSSRENFKNPAIKFTMNGNLIKRIKKLIKRGR